MWRGGTDRTTLGVEMWSSSITVPTEVVIDLPTETSLSGIEQGNDEIAPLCLPELIALIDELVEMRVPSVRLVGLEHELGARRMSLIHYIARTGLQTTVEIPIGVAQGALDDLIQARPLILSLLLDHLDPREHNRIHGPGSWQATMRLIETAVERGLGVEVRTRPGPALTESLEEMFEVVVESGVRQWCISLPQGLHRRMQSSARLLDLLCRRVAVLPASGTEIVLDEMPQYHLVPAPRSSLSRLSSPSSARVRVADSRTTAFVSGDGQIFPSRTLRLPIGNVRNDLVIGAFRFGSWSRRLRDVTQLRGKCGRCEMRSLCGGSRVRAWLASGDPMGEDPACGYVVASSGRPARSPSLRRLEEDHREV